MTDPFNPFAYKSLAEIIEEDPQVTELSKWSSPTWYFEARPGYSPAAHSIHWSIAVDQSIIDHFKLVAALVFSVEDGRTPANTIKFAVGMRHAARFMNQNSVFDFGDFDEEAFKLYRTFLKKTLSDPAEVANLEAESEELRVAEEAEAEEIRRKPKQRVTKAVDRSVKRKPRQPRSEAKAIGSDDHAVSRSVALMRLMIWRQVVDAGPHLKRLGVPVVPTDPFSTEAPGKIAKDLADTFEEAIPPLPDEVAKPILAFAHRTIRDPADDVILLQKGFLEIDPRGGARPWVDVNRRLADHVASFEFTKREAGSAWRGPIVVGEKDTTGGHELRKLIVLIRDVCAIVLLSDIGIRMSELCGIEIDDREIDEGLPSCIEIDTSISQVNEHFFLKGFLTKKQKEPKPERWLLGARPVGSDWEPPSVRAVRLLERLLQPWRRLSDDPSISKHLFLGFEGGPLPRARTSILAPLAPNLRQSMRETIAAHVPLKELLAPDIKANSELSAYADTDGRCIRPHQWRKTFLRYLIRIDEGLLPAISRHFKHMTLAITEGSYMPKDPALLDAADSVRAREVTRFLYERRYGKKRSVGRLDATIAESNAQLFELIGERSYEDARTDLEEFADDNDLEVFAAAHGQCVIGLRPDEARCHRFSDRPGWAARAPDVVVRTPSLCAGCANFSPGSGSADFWRRWYSENMTAWIESGYEPSFRVAHSRAVQAAAILRSLKVPLPNLQARSPRPPHINPYTGKELQ